MLTQLTLKEILDYDPLTGIFTWKLKISRKNNIGAIAGTLGWKGYVKIGIGSKSYRANRLAWLYMTGEWPKNLVDHKNRIRHDNRWDNLRDFTSKENVANKQIYTRASLILQGMLSL